MLQQRRGRGRERGQTLVLFVLLVTFGLIPAIGLAVDGGYALAQRRAAQNASDFAALAGARIVAEWISGDTTNGTDTNVRSAIATSIQLNGGTTLTFGSPNGPAYVDKDGAVIGWVGAGSIPAGSVGVTVNSSRTWAAFFHGALIPDTWSAGSTATATGGYNAGPPGGGVFPAGIAEAFFNGRSTCSGPVSSDPTSPCYPQHLTPGTLNVPGGFGWLKLGAHGKCAGYGLGMDPNDGCDPSEVFLQTEIGHPGGASDPTPGDSFGCCSQVGHSQDFIGSLPGNKTAANCDWIIAHSPVVTVPVWDYAGGTGDGAYYHIVGFTGFQITGCDGGKDLEGVWRQRFFLGPTTTSPGFAGADLAVQLVR